MVHSFLPFFESPPPPKKHPENKTQEGGKELFVGVVWAFPSGTQGLLLALCSSITPERTVWFVDKPESMVYKAGALTAVLSF